VCLLAACATTRPRHLWVDEALEAENKQAAGDFDAAEAEYRRLLNDAPTPSDRRWLTYNLGRVALERGERSEALELFADVYEEEVVDRFGANAMYDAAQLQRSHDMRLALIRRYPGEVAAEFALADIVRTFETDHPKKLEQYLKELHSDVLETEVDDNVLFSLAALRLSRLDDADGALEAYRTLYRQDPDGPLADDAIWEMARIYRSYQMWEPAVELLELLASDTESSWFVGLYRSEWVDDAVYELGMIHLLWLEDPDTARRWFKNYLKRYPEALYADDAAWQLVELERLQGEQRAYREALEEFSGRWPESRHARIARRRLGVDG
jgi:tetratricopeptide (TPR) repeat protein